MSLKDPHLKMSKSHESPRSRIVITDAPDVIREKVKHALTDSLEGISYDPVKRPGVSNLIDILRHVHPNGQSLKEIVADCGSVSMKAFKNLVAEAIIVEFGSFRTRYQELKELKSQQFITEVSAEGCHKAQASAEKTMLAVRNAIGLWECYDIRKTIPSCVSVHGQCRLP